MILPPLILFNLPLRLGVSAVQIPVFASSPLCAFALRFHSQVKPGLTHNPDHRVHPVRPMHDRVAHPSDSGTDNALQAL
jgi:hypothetical protein